VLQTAAASHSAFLSWPSTLFPSLIRHELLVMPNTKTWPTGQRFRLFALQDS
jgi:hypothetical protein